MFYSNLWKILTIHSDTYYFKVVINLTGNRTTFFFFFIKENVLTSQTFVIAKQLHKTENEMPEEWN